VEGFHNFPDRIKDTAGKGQAAQIKLLDLNWGIDSIVVFCFAESYR